MFTVWKMPVFGVILVCVQSECGKMRTSITPNKDTVYVVDFETVDHEANLKSIEKLLNNTCGKYLEVFENLQ